MNQSAVTSEFEERAENKEQIKDTRTLLETSHRGIIEAREQFAISLRKKKKDEILKLKRKKMTGLAQKADEPMVTKLAPFKILSIQSLMVYLRKLETLASSDKSDDQ